MSETRRTSPAAASTRHNRWPGWIWSVPIAALGIAVWLLVRALTQGGTDITITFAEAHGIDPNGTDIIYRGLKVGSVTDASLTQDGSAVQVRGTIQDSASPFLTTGTVFWLQGTHPSLSNLAALGAILSGPKIVMEPGAGESTTHFDGLAHKPLPAKHGAPVLCTVSFEDAVGGLSPGDTVTVRGFPVGEVREIGFHYNVQTEHLDTPVTLALYLDLFHMQGTTLPENPEALKAALNRLVEAGLRVQLERDPPLIGSYHVTLEMVPDAPAAHLDLSKAMPELTTAPGGGLDSIVADIKNIPIDRIAQNILDVTQHANKLVSSPNLADSVSQLDASLQAIHDVVKDTSPKVDKISQTLRHTATRLDQAAQAAAKILGSAPSQTGLDDTMREIKAAARAVRSFADYLNRHPEALIKGRSGR